MKVAALIPARGGSKGLPRKNVLPFSGKPLIAHSIIQALESKHIDGEVYVSTDDKEIKDISLSFGAKVIDRPKEISGDEATTEDVITHFLSEVECDVVVLIQCTSPLRPDKVFDDALTTFFEDLIYFRSDSMISLSETHRFHWKESSGLLCADYNYTNRPRRQDIKEKKYIETGSFYIFTRKIYYNTFNRLGGVISYHLMDEKYSYEIDTIEDFVMLEALAENKKYE